MRRGPSMWQPWRAWLGIGIVLGWFVAMCILGILVGPSIMSEWR